MPAADEFEVTAWRNGSPGQSGAGYGLKISLRDRDNHFDRSWRSVRLFLPGIAQAVDINVDKSSFWSETCRELIHKDIGAWLAESGFAPWPKGEPPRFRLHVLGNASFRLESARGN